MSVREVRRQTARALTRVLAKYRQASGLPRQPGAIQIMGKARFMKGTTVLSLEQALSKGSQNIFEMVVASLFSKVRTTSFSKSQTIDGLVKYKYTFGRIITLNLNVLERSPQLLQRYIVDFYPCSTAIRVFISVYCGQKRYSDLYSIYGNFTYKIHLKKNNKQGAYSFKILSNSICINILRAISQTHIQATECLHYKTLHSTCCSVGETPTGMFF